MSLMYKQKEQQNNSQSLLTLRPKEKTNVTYNQRTQLQTKLIQKQRITVYVEENKYFVEHATAYALGLVNVRAVMLDKPKLVEINSNVHNKLRAAEELEINYVSIENKKQKLRVFADQGSYCVEIGAAYALGLINVEELNNSEEEYYYISEELLFYIKKQYDVEMYALKLFEESHKKM